MLADTRSTARAHRSRSGRCRTRSRRGRGRSLWESAPCSGRVPRLRSQSRSRFATRPLAGASRQWWAPTRERWTAGRRFVPHVMFAYTAAGVLYAVAAILLAGVRINIDPAFGASYLRADRRGRPRGRGALGRAGQRGDVDLGGGGRAHVPDPDAAHPSDSLLRCSSSCSAARSSSECSSRATGGVAPGSLPAGGSKPPQALTPK